MLGEILDDLLTSPITGPCISATRRFPARPAVAAPFPASLDPRLVEALRARGIEQLYSHQARVWELVDKGQHVVVVTPTASGKTLCYNLPVLEALLQSPDARMLYLFPTKALAQDQLAELEALGRSLPELRMFTYDGDTPQDARRAVRARANLVLTNPDMLHSGILPHHTKWLNLFQNLRYVVVDELHAYRGVFGSHLANVMRRLKRICAHYGSAPQFVMASATIANPRELAEHLIGEPVEEVSESGAPAGEKIFLCYNPPVVNPELGIRAPYLGEAARLVTRFLKRRIATIAFAQSRLATEVLLSTIKAAVADKTGDAGIVRGYRGGYLPTRRRAVEQGLRSGEVLGVVSTSALELGVDIGHLDAAVLAGYPGTIASLWQQAGRAGRRSGQSAAILVATSAPLDQFMATHPDYLFGTPPEQARINPDNPFILVSHLKCAAFELPFAEGETFGGRDVRMHLAALEDEGLLHRAGDRWHWTSETYPADHVSLRTVTTDNVLVIDTTARDDKQVKRRQIIAEVDWSSAFATIYPKAIYLVESEPYEVKELHYREDEEKVAYVKRVSVDYFTDAISAKGVWILRRLAEQGGRDWQATQGEVLVAEKFGLPVVTFIDTPGAYPGVGAEERGQAHAVARNILEMSRLRTPVVCVVIGEGGSGGALAIGVGDRILMLENAYYSVISPEGCSSILWKTAEHANKAAEALKLTAKDLLGFGVIDQIIPEPLGGAHRNGGETIRNVREAILAALATLDGRPVEDVLRARYEKVRRIGVLLERPPRDEDSALEHSGIDDEDQDVGEVADEGIEAGIELDVEIP